MSALLTRISPMVDLRRIIENWAVFLQSAGIYPDRLQSAAAIIKVMFTHRLWQYQTPRRLQVELFRQLGLPDALRRGNISEDVLAEGIDGVPPVFLKMAADLLSTRSGITADELLSLWPVNWSESDMSADRSSSAGRWQKPGVMQLSPEVLDFLESGIMPVPAGEETTDAVEQRLVAGISRCLRYAIDPYLYFVSRSGTSIPSRDDVIPSGRIPKNRSSSKPVLKISSYANKQNVSTCQLNTSTVINTAIPSSSQYSVNSQLCCLEPKRYCANRSTCKSR
jgi:hypothetical protein